MTQLLTIRMTTLIKLLSDGIKLQAAMRYAKHTPSLSLCLTQCLRASWKDELSLEQNEDFLDYPITIKRMEPHYGGVLRTKVASAAGQRLMKSCCLK